MIVSDLINIIEEISILTSHCRFGHPVAKYFLGSALLGRITQHWLEASVSHVPVVECEPVLHPCVPWPPLSLAEGAYRGTTEPLRLSRSLLGRGRCFDRYPSSQNIYNADVTCTNKYPVRSIALGKVGARLPAARANSFMTLLVIFSIHRANGEIQSTAFRVGTNVLCGRCGSLEALVRRFQRVCEG